MGKGSNTPSELQAASERLAPRPVDVQEEEVVINLGQPFEDYLSEYFQYLDATVHARGGTLGFTLEDFQKYIRTLIHSRVAWVRRERYRVHPTDDVCIPTVVSLALAALGRVNLDEVGIVLVPSFDAPSSELMTGAEVMSFSKLLEPLRFMNITFAKQYERDRRGAFDLMALQYIENHEKGSGVYAHDRSPAKAFAPVSYLLGLKQLHTLLGSRVVYGDAVSLTTALRELAVV